MWLSHVIKTNPVVVVSVHFLLILIILLDAIETHVERAAVEVGEGRSQLGKAVRYKVRLVLNISLPNGVCYGVIL